MRYLIIIILSIFSIFIFGSCAKNEDLIPTSELIDGNIITFTVNDFEGVETRAKFLSTEDIAQSRAVDATIADETRLNNLVVFLYKSDGTYSSHFEAKILSSPTPTYSGKATFILPLDAIVGDYKVLAFSSGDGIFNDTFENYATKTYDELKDYVFAKCKILEPNHEIYFTSALPMYGESSLTYKGFGVPSKLELNLTRAVAKVPLTNKDPNLVLQGAKIVNYRLNPYLFVGEKYNDEIKSVYSNYNEHALASSDKILHGLYSSPNFVGVTTSKDRGTTAVLVYASYKGGPNAFYRINICGGVGKPQLIKRNNQYDIVIHSASEAGTSASLACEGANAPTLEASVND